MSTSVYSVMSTWYFQIWVYLFRNYFEYVIHSILRNYFFSVSSYSTANIIWPIFYFVPLYILFSWLKNIRLLYYAFGIYFPLLCHKINSFIYASWLIGGASQSMSRLVTHGELNLWKLYNIQFINNLQGNSKLAISVPLGMRIHPMFSKY